jgi:peptide-methionine (S)-S-oxide reductase
MNFIVCIFFSYHQKYRLQQHSDLKKLLGLNSVEDLVSSHIAARLNGYVVGRGGVKQFDEEAPKLGINEELAQEIRKYVVKYEGQGLFC